jgi:hypothetical protein
VKTINMALMLIATRITTSSQQHLLDHSQVAPVPPVALTSRRARETGPRASGSNTVAGSGEVLLLRLALECP